MMLFLLRPFSLQHIFDSGRLATVISPGLNRNDQHQRTGICKGIQVGGSGCVTTLRLLVRVLVIVLVLVRALVLVLVLVRVLVLLLVLVRVLVLVPVLVLVLVPVLVRVLVLVLGLVLVHPREWRRD